MSYTMKENLANPTNYGGKRDLSAIKWIVIHYTANDGDTDEANANYFRNNAYLNASAHYFVDSDSVTRSVPDNYTAWSVGGSKYPSCSTTGGGKYNGSCTNYNSISIELCDDVRNGTIYPSAGAIDNALDLTRQLMKKYNINKSHVIRHFDVVGKLCPAYWCGSKDANAKWLSEFWNRLDEVSSDKAFKPYVVRVLKKRTIRHIPSTKGEPNGYCKVGICFTIIEEKKYKNGSAWGLLKSGAGWICLRSATVIACERVE